MGQNYLTGQLAKKAGVNIETIRFYERKGLLSEPMRNASGYRQYPKETVQRVLFIKNAQKLGFTLREIKELLSITLKTKTQCQQVKSEIEHKIKGVEEKIQQLQEINRALRNLLEKCKEEGDKDSCPIIKFLYGEEAYD